MKDLDAGIESLREVVNSTPKSHPYRAIFLHRLANGPIQKGSETFDGDGVDEWISVVKEALEATPESHPDRGELLYGLGLGLLAVRQRARLQLASTNRYLVSKKLSSNQTHHHFAVSRPVCVCYQYATIDSEA